MAMLSCPFTRPIDTAARLLRLVTTHAASDGHICDAERTLIEAVREHKEGLIHRSSIYRLSRHLERMEEPTEYTQRLASMAGLNITAIDDYRDEPMPANVVMLRRDEPIEA